MSRFLLPGVLVLGGLLANVGAVRAQERGPRTPPSAPVESGVKIIRSMSTSEMESFLNEMHFDFRKTPSNNPNDKNVVFYDFKKNNYDYRVTYFGGQDLMVDVLFPEAKLETVNNWNRRARFTRAVQYEDNKGKFLALESNFDFLGGVTMDGLKHFFKTYDQEARDFENFLQNEGIRSPAVKDDSTYKGITNDKLERILNNLNINFRKNQGNDSTTYSYTLLGQQVRLINFNGKDIMADAAFKKLSAEQINRYNYNNKFVRVVAYKDNQGEYTALEMNLDCEGGMTDTILSGFILFFEENVSNFSKYVENPK